MKEENNRVFIEHVTDFLEACSEKSPVFMEVKAYLEIIRALDSQAKKTSDKGTREAIEKVIAELVETGKDVIDRVPLGKDDNSPVEVAGIVHMSDSTRDHLLDALRSDTSGEFDVLRSIIPKFAALLQGPGTNELVKLNSRRAKPTVDTFTGVGTISADNLTAFIANSAREDRPLRPSTWKLLDTCTVLLNSKTNYKGKVDGLLPTQVRIPLEKYAELCGKPNTESAIKELRKQVKEDLETLASIEISWTEQKGRGNSKDYSKVRVFSSRGIIKGNIVVGFSPEIANYLNDSYIMQYPIDLLRVDDRNPSTYLVGRKLALHSSIDNNRRKGTADIIGVSTLLDTCAFTIPSYEDVAAQRGSLSQKIISPLEKALDALENNGVIRWEYCNSKGEPLTDQQIKTFDYETFSQAYIRFEVIGAPARALPEPEEKPKPKKRGRPPKKKD